MSGWEWVISKPCRDGSDSPAQRQSRGAQLSGATRCPATPVLLGRYVSLSGEHRDLAVSSDHVTWPATFSFLLEGGPVEGDWPSSPWQVT